MISCQKCPKIVMDFQALRMHNAAFHQDVTDVEFIPYTSEPIILGCNTSIIADSTTDVESGGGASGDFGD